MEDVKPQTQTASPNLVEVATNVAEEGQERARARGEMPRPQEKGQIHPSLLLALLLVFGLVMVVKVGDSSSVTPVSAATSLRETIYVTVLALNAEFQDTGLYPADLETVGMDEEGLVYTRESGGYTLVAEEEGARAEYRSGDDLEPFRAAFEALLPPFQEG